MKGKSEEELRALVDKFVRGVQHLTVRTISDHVMGLLDTLGEPEPPTSKPKRNARPTEKAVLKRKREHTKAYQLRKSLKDGNKLSQKDAEWLKRYDETKRKQKAG